MPVDPLPHSRFYEQWGTAITVDSDGNAYVLGQTPYGDFPVTGNALQTSCNSCGIAPAGPGEYLTLQDLFVTQVYSSGELGWSTFLGGSLWEAGSDIEVSPAGNVYVTGYTMSGDFPVTGDAVQPTLAVSTTLSSPCSPLTGPV
jgi:hypothetical protein